MKKLFNHFTKALLPIFILTFCALDICSQDVRKDLKAAQKSNRKLELRAPDLYRKVLDSPDFSRLSIPDQLDVYDMLGWLYHHELKFLDAEPLFKKAVELRENNDGNNSIELKDRAYVSTKNVFYVNSLMFLGKTQLTLNKLEDSRVSFKKALITIENYALETDTDKWECLVGMARSFYRESRLSEARPLYEKALTVSALYNGTHFLNSEMLCDLANIYRESGDVRQAEEYYKKAISIMEWYAKNASKGVKTFDLIAVRNLREYARLLRKMNRNDEAMKMEEKADSYKLENN